MGKTQHTYSIILCRFPFLLLDVWRARNKLLFFYQNDFVVRKLLLKYLQWNYTVHIFPSFLSAQTYRRLPPSTVKNMDLYNAHFEWIVWNTSTVHDVMCSPGWVKRLWHSRCWGDRLPFALFGSIGVKLQQLIFHGQVVTQLRYLWREINANWI